MRGSRGCAGVVVRTPGEVNRSGHSMLDPWSNLAEKSLGAQLLKPHVDNQGSPNQRGHAVLQTHTAHYW